MKARYLKKLLNDTKYHVNNNEDYIAVGSPLCHNLISVDKKTLKLSYALDTWREGRESLEKDSKSELLFIWDKLAELIESGEIREIIEGKDEIENPIPVYLVKDGVLIESFTDTWETNSGFPNVDIDGYTMYRNVYFQTPKEALEEAISTYDSYSKAVLERIQEIEADLLKRRTRFLNLYEWGEKLTEELEILLNKESLH